MAGKNQNQATFSKARKLEIIQNIQVPFDI
jgi:hypothetical protein